LCIRNNKCILLTERGKIIKKNHYFHFSQFDEKEIGVCLVVRAVLLSKIFFLFIIILKFLIRRLAKLVLPKQWHFVRYKRKNSIENLCILPKIHAFYEILSIIRAFRQQCTQFVKKTPTIHAFHENTRKIRAFHNCLLQNLSSV
jgi:hypothetical protein